MNYVKFVKNLDLSTYNAFFNINKCFMCLSKALLDCFFF